jgi:hypothetical protein
VIGDTMTPSGYQPASLEIHLSKDTALPGENVTALLVTPLTDCDVLLTISSASGTEYSVVHVDGNVRELRLRFPEHGSERLSLAAAMISESVVFPCRKDVTLDPSARRLTINASSTERSSLREIFTIRLTDRAGVPVRGEISAAWIAGEEEPLADPLADLWPARPASPDRETSLSRWSIAGSGAGSGGPVQPECARRVDWIAGHGEVPCEPTSPDSRRYDLEAISSVEAEVGSVVFREDGVPTDGRGEAKLQIPPCPASKCRLRIWATGEPSAFGFLDESVVGGGR